jgi:hypothetical protein
MMVSMKMLMFVYELMSWQRCWGHRFTPRFSAQIIPYSPTLPSAKSGKYCSFGTRSAESEQVGNLGYDYSTTQPRPDYRAYASRPVNIDII